MLQLLEPASIIIIIISVGSIEERTRHKDEKYKELRAGMKRIYKDCKVTQGNVVFDFLGGYHTLSPPRDTISQKWILCQNADIAKKFYEFPQRKCK